jgi:hypothetical protein
LAEITVIRHNFASGARKGPAIRGAFPWLVSFRITPAIVGKWHIIISHEKKIAILVIA